MGSKVRLYFNEELWCPKDSFYFNKELRCLYFLFILTKSLGVLIIHETEIEI